MAGPAEFSVKAEVDAIDRASGDEFLSPERTQYYFDGKAVEFSDCPTPAVSPLLRSNGSHATVVLARARALRLRQALPVPK